MEISQSECDRFDSIIQAFEIYFLKFLFLLTLDTELIHGDSLKSLHVNWNISYIFPHDVDSTHFSRLNFLTINIIA